MSKTLTGKVEYFDGKFYHVRCSDAPAESPHLERHCLSPSLMREGTRMAQVGDTVELTYYSTYSIGYWHVSRIVKS